MIEWFRTIAVATVGRQRLWSGMFGPSGSYRRLGGEFLWIVFGQGVATLGGMVGVRVLTGALSPASYGELALAMTLATLGQQLIMGPISGACVRYFAPAQESGRLVVYLQAVKQLLTGATLLIVGVTTVAGFSLWALGYVQWLWLVLVASLFGLLSGYNSSLNGIQNAARQRVLVAWHQSLMQWLRFPLALAMVALLGSSSTAAFLGYVLALAVILGSQLVFFKRRILPESTSRMEVSPGGSNPFVKGMLGYAWPFTTWGVFTWVQQASNRWALQTFGVTSDVGFYAVLHQLGYYPITLLSGLMMQLVYPILFSWAGDGSDRVRLNHIRRLNNLLVLGAVLLTVLGTILAFLLHTPIFSLLTAPEYRGVSSLLPWMVLSGGLFASSQIAALSLLSSVNSQGLIAPKIVTALLGTLLNFAGAYWFGLQGVVFAIVTFSLVCFVWISYLAKPSRVFGAS